MWCHWGFIGLPELYAVRVAAQHVVSAMQHDIIFLYVAPLIVQRSLILTLKS